MVAAAQYAAPANGPHPDLVAAVVRFAERQAEFTVAAIEALVAEAEQRGDVLDARSLPVGFLLELGAIMQLKVWELNGVRSLVSAELPSFDTAIKDLNVRVQANPRAFNQFESAVLSRRLLDVWMDHFSWTAPATLVVDVVIGRIDEDASIEAIAQLLWLNRHAGNGAN